MPGERTLIGMLTPSSNTILEPITCAMLHDLPDVTAHFGRFPVTEIALGDRALAQFDDAPMLEAAKLLADAKVDVICWNGTSAGWLGFERDRELGRRIEDATGIRTCSSVLALGEIFARDRVRRFGLVTPYTEDVQRRIVETFAREGYECVAERHLGISINFDFSEVVEDTIRGMVREVATARPEAITIFCTNLRGALVVEELEQETGIPIHDTVATAVWASLRATGADRPVAGWGSLLRKGA